MRELFTETSLTVLAEEFLSNGQEKQESSPELEKDEYYSILSNSRRRDVIRYMANFSHENPFTVGEMATGIAALENNKAPVQITSDERKRVYVGLYQHHLDQLDDAEVVEYNSNRGTVNFGPNFELLSEAVGDKFYEPQNFVTLEDVK